MNSHAPLFEETGDENADQLVLKLTQACEFLMERNQILQSKQDELQAKLSQLRTTEDQTKQKVESLIRRLKLLEQEA